MSIWGRSATSSLKLALWSIFTPVMNSGPKVQVIRPGKNGTREQLHCQYTAVQRHLLHVSEWISIWLDMTISILCTFHFWWRVSGSSFFYLVIWMKREKNYTHTCPNFRCLFECEFGGPVSLWCHNRLRSVGDLRDLFVCGLFPLRHIALGRIADDVDHAVQLHRLLGGAYVHKACGESVDIIFSKLVCTWGHFWRIEFDCLWWKG